MLGFSKLNDIFFCLKSLILQNCFSLFESGLDGVIEQNIVINNLVTLSI